MAISSYGYDGTLSELPWSKMWDFMGKGPVVRGSGDFATTFRTGVDRTVRVAAGEAAGNGVYDVSDGFIDIALPVVTGSPKWTTIVIRRDWSGTAGTTTVVPVLGGTTQAVAAGLQNVPGVMLDTPIALVRVSAGVQVPDGGAAGVQPIDLRVTLAQARSGWGPWIALPLITTALQNGPSGVGLQYRLSIDGNDVQIRGTVQRTPGTITLKDPSDIAQLPPEITPTSNRYRVVASERVGSVSGAGGSPGALVDNEAFSMRALITSSGLLTVIGAHEPHFVVFDGLNYTRFSALG